MLKEKMITEDEDRREEDKIQKMTDAHIRDIDQILKDKESEMMEI